MIDKQKIVESLKDSLSNLHCGFVEGIGNVYAVSEETINHTLELLKEQEPEEPVVGMCHFARHSTKPYGMEFWYTCGSCGVEIKRSDKFCHECGKEVKWE